VRRSANVVAGTGLVALMAVGSVVMWLVIPFGLIYAAGRLTTSQQPSMGIYVGLAVAIPLLMVLVARILGRLDHTYARVMGIPEDGRYRPGWMRSMRAERTSTRRRTVLDVVMVCSVGVAVLCSAVWFFAFAGSSIPS
jgi:hypothetical protein